VIDIPDGVDATVLFPVKAGTAQVRVNGASQNGTAVENGSRLALHLAQSGHYELQSSQ
jgi:hypothetical protein